MTLEKTLERYCLSRSRSDKTEQLELANELVDEHIPFLIQRLGEIMIERNNATAELSNKL